MPEIYMDVDAAVTVPVNILPLIASADFKTVLASETYNEDGLDLIWNFVTTAGVQTHNAITPTDTGGAFDWVNIGHGMYNIELPASGQAAGSNNDREGFGWFTGVATDALPWRGPVIGFRAAGLNNLLIDDAYSATRGLAGTALPDAAADAAGGLPISDAGGLPMDRLDAAITTRSAPGTAQTITANQAVNVAQWGGANIVTPAVTGSPVVTLGATQAAYAPAKAGDQMDLVNAPNGTAVTAIQSGLATPTNITAGTITTVTNLTNAPTVGDLTAAMKSSVTAAVPTAVQNGAAVLAAAVLNPIDANVQEVNDVTLTGDGSATPWGPV